ncbi:metallophosphatase [Agaricicola taiwanensis]|uniref:Metallophosphatase n=1 Tax=Agaricicola taiwanensis TaxID=591372 RepID=A0A8J2VJ40_9RHOB|nr:ligase-associated DNA damage response endonuclease PdeM [Agaricicola taiwanensis]GGE31452.1 metallophosphatase [Agaricicola taiwanensis]
MSDTACPVPAMPGVAARRRAQAVEVLGHELVIDPTGAVWWPSEAMLIVADLHLEKGSSRAARGYLVPPYDTSAALAGLVALRQRYQPKAVLALGDTFHDRRAGERMAPRDADTLASLSQGCDWLWIAGNHDREAPALIRGDWLSEWRCGSLVFRHEPTAAAAPGEIAGHLHPVAKIQVRGRVLRCRCVVTDGSRAVLPAFGAYTGGLNICDAAFEPVMARQLMRLWMLGDEAVYPVGQDMLLPDRSVQSRRKATLASQPQATARKAATKP